MSNNWTTGLADTARIPRCEQEFCFPSVGAFDLCPGRGEVQRTAIKSFIGNVLDAVDSGQPYREEEGLFS